MDNKLKLLSKSLPQVFSSDEACFALGKHYKSPLKALAALEKSGHILRIRRGLYAFKEDFDNLMAAGRIYGLAEVIEIS